MSFLMSKNSLQRFCPLEISIDRFSEKNLTNAVDGEKLGPNFWRENFLRREILIKV